MFYLNSNFANIYDFENEESMQMHQGSVIALLQATQMNEPS